MMFAAWKRRRALRSARRTWAIRSVLILAATLSSGLTWLFALSDNFSTVRPGQLYRSGQMSPDALASKVRRLGIKTVINLRGSHPEAGWYRLEREATLHNGATQVDLAMSSCEWMSRSQARALLAAIDSADRPILVHCFHGSERTGLVSAFVELLRPGSTLGDADRQFSIRHLYFGMGDGVVTHRQLDAYKDWLKAHHLGHAPDTLRLWLSQGFDPGQPSREAWEFDPYPLVVTTRPAQVVSRIAIESKDHLEGNPVREK